MVDLHCHVLPGLDDGPPSLDGSLALAQAARDAGIDTLVATPHVNPRTPTPARTIADGVASLSRELARSRIEVQVRTGGELDASVAARLTDEELAGYRLGGGEWLLMECPLAPAAAGSFEARLRALQGRGHRIVLAHPERSPLVRGRADMLVRLVDEGMLCSITAGSLSGDFGSVIRRFSLELLTAGLVHNVTSDAHDAVRRPPGLREAMSAVADGVEGFEDQAEWLTESVPRAIVDGAPIPARPGVPAGPRGV